MRTGTVTAFHRLNIRELIEDWHLITVTAGPRADVLVLCGEQPPDYRIAQGLGIFPKLQADQTNRFRIYHHTPWDTVTVTTLETPENIHEIQPIGNDRLLAVRSRARDASDKNAHIYRVEGQHVRSFHAGDGIEDVQTTSNGQIWVSYFDEGVFGGSGPGQDGVVCFRSAGEPLVRFNQLPGPSRSIADCYAMNVVSDREVWLYYYTDFPLVRLREGRFDREWTGIPVTGSGAFAVDEDRALFAGSYDQPSKLFSVSLHSMQAEELQPVDRDGQLIDFRRAFGRGSTLYLSTEDELYTLDLADL